MATILIVRSNAGMYGGIESQVMHLARHLTTRTDLEPILVTTPGANPLAEQFINFGYKVEAIRFHPYGTILQSIADLRKVIAKHVPILVQAHMFRESVASRFACAGTGARHIFRVHTYIDCSHIAAGRKAAYHLLDFVTQPLVDQYLPISSHVTRELRFRSWIRASAIESIPDGVEGPSTGPTAIPWPLTEFRIAMISNIVAGKGHSTLFKALAILRSQGIIVSTVLFGSFASDALADELYALADRLGIADQITYAGWKQDVWAYLSEIQIVVLPSMNEGTPNCLLEAMARGKLVIASAVGGIPEFLQHGHNGWLHAPNDAGQLARMILEAFRTDRSQVNAIRANAWTTWDANFKVSDSVAKQFSTYRRYSSALNERPPAE